MAQFADITITRSGLDMIAKSQTGDQLIFTGIKIGDGQIGEQSIPDMTDLINPKKDVPINSVTAKTDGHAEIIGIIDNEDVDVGFFVREIGIFAKINDGGTPALYGYANAGNLASYLADKSIPMDAIKFKIDIVVGNADNVSFTSDKSIVYVTQENLDTHNASADSHPDIRQKITNDIKAHNELSTAHPSMDFIKSLSVASDGLHYRTRNASADSVLNLINTLEATLTQGTEPTGNNGTVLELLSGIVHQIKALSGKTNWWETPKDSFETLSAGIVAGDVSDPNAWWVKFGGTIPLIIQGGKASANTTGRDPVHFPVAFTTIACPTFTTIGGSPQWGFANGTNQVSLTGFNTLIGNDTGTFPLWWLASGV